MHFYTHDYSSRIFQICRVLFHSLQSAHHLKTELKKILNEIKIFPLSQILDDFIDHRIQSIMLIAHISFLYSVFGKNIHPPTRYLADEIVHDYLRYLKI